MNDIITYFVTYMVHKNRLSKKDFNNIIIYLNDYDDPNLWSNYLLCNFDFKVFLHWLLLIRNINVIKFIEKRVVVF